MNEKAIIAMSGGVDSTVAAYLVKNSGYETSGVSMILTENIKENADARSAAALLGIPYSEFDFTVEFRQKVIEPFIQSYEKGETPNPCVECNRYLKFAILLDKALTMRAEKLATGHYVQIEKSGDRFLLKKGTDPQKDQSYVLYSLKQEALSHILFPLGTMKKNEVREIARSLNLANAEKQESQDICFIPDGDYGRFMESYAGKHYPKGDIIDTDGNVLGRHNGIIRYTLGQRKGLGVAANHPVYVTAKNMAANTVTLGNENDLFSKTLTAKNINLIACSQISGRLRVTAKTRYLQTEKPAWARQTDTDEIRVDFDEDQRAITPGQSVVLYDGDVVIGGGIISNQ